MLSLNDVAQEKSLSFMYVGLEEPCNSFTLMYFANHHIPVTSGNVLRWPTMGETYLDVLGCLETVLVGLLSGLMDFNMLMLWQWI